MDLLAKRINELEESNGISYTEREKRYALGLVTTGNQSEAARQAGASKQRAAQTGREMAMDPKIQQLVEQLNKYQTVELTEEFITNGLVKEALDADNSRDRREALHLLGKTRKLKMFTESVEQTTVSKSDQELLEQIEREFGKEAAQKAKEEMGIE